MSIAPIEGLSSALNGLSGLTAATTSVSSAAAAGATTATTATAGTGAATAAVAANGKSFAATLVSSLDHVQRLQATSSDLAVQAATGDLDDVHDYTIAAAKASMATEITVAIRNKALEAFNEIMRMQV